MGTSSAHLAWVTDAVTEEAMQVGLTFFGDSIQVMNMNSGRRL